MSSPFPSEPGAGRSIEFTQGLVPPVAFLVATVLLAVAVPLVLPPLGSIYVELAVQSALVSLFAAVALVVLRWEGLPASDVGLTRENVVPGVLVVALVVVLQNALAAVEVLLTEGSVRATIPDGYSLPVFLAIGLSQVVFVGVAEEFAFRAYLQNKLVALLGGGSDRIRKAAAVLLGVALFTVWHVPQRVFVQGLTSPVEIVQSLVVVVILGLLLGVLYEYTRNVVLVGVLHGVFNWQPFVFSQSGVSFPVVLLVLVAVVWYYRRWASHARPRDFAPQLQASVAR